MKLIILLLLACFSAVKSLGAESLFLYLPEDKLGSKVLSGGGNFVELPKVNILDHQFSAYYEVGEDRTVINVGLYLRSQTSERSTSDISELFEEMRRWIVTECGKSGQIELPNFQDATEREGLLFVWKDKSRILILQKVQTSGRMEIDVRYSEFDYFISTLGADTKSFLLPEIQSKSGGLKLPLEKSDASDESRKAGNVSHQARGMDRAQGSSTEQVNDLGTKASEKNLESRRLGGINWMYFTALAILLGAPVFFLMRKFLRSRV